MSKTNHTILTDTFGRKHNYLRISLTERCNLRCTYCMPADGIALSPKEHLMTADEIYIIAKTFVDLGVNKIRLTGGEPMVRKDFPLILEKLASLPVELGITTNGVLADRFIPLLKKNGIKTITISIDSLHKDKFQKITRRNEFEKVWNTIQLFQKEGFKVKLNIVLIKGFNDQEIVDFINLTKDKDLIIRFIEFMPFDGNQWNIDKLVTHQEILDKVSYIFPLQIKRLSDTPNDTSRNYKIEGYQGSFAIISSVTNPFCDTCNRIRLTADGKLKNCLFSGKEFSLLKPLRANQPLNNIIKSALQHKFATRGGMDTPDKLQNPDLHSKNRSMIAIGG
ncbi:GTP 3',8-cyclase MoaA [Aquimarina sp. 2201CG14-23]|uniref:GTP 3',8-cyclase MoaA n=1 Tax=Aquimarina mycalae TaxID=3040073 RepID=UPI00247823A0|nr:GTP 3',8-cyclase MoaA [Aquimarina sp. 2201CG14-23]MDH7444170.1 GTP 3',8-cyclase MoaA [Aquimarina sp. 2201CG14-23]